jgi:DHA2 family multidrug resistance protein
MATLALPVPAPHDRGAVYRHRYLIAFAVSLASVLELVDTSIVNVAIPHMMGNLGATLEEIAWVSTGYIVANVIILPITSFLSDTFGRRNYYTGSIALFTAASFFCGSAGSLESLVLWRIVQGIGGGALISTAQAILFDVFPPEERGTGQAIFGMSVMVGPTIGPTLGGWLTDNYAWPWIFYINLPLGGLAGWLCWRFVPEPSHVRRRLGGMDWLGLALLIAGIGALQVLLERGESQGWFESREILAETLVAITALVGFVVHELRTPHPIVDLRILRNRQLATAVAFAMALGFALYASVFALPVFLQQVIGYDAWDTGRVILPGALASAVTMAAMGRLSQRVDVRVLITAGVVLFAISMWQHYHFTVEVGTGDLFWPIILRGVGLGCIFVPLTAAAVADLSPMQIPQGTGLFNLSRQLGGSFGIAITATLLTRFSEQGREALRTHASLLEAPTRGWMQGVTQRLAEDGGTMAETQLRATRLLDLAIRKQASVIAFEKVFLVMGVTFLLALPLLLLLRTGRVRGGTGGAH